MHFGIFSDMLHKWAYPEIEYASARTVRMSSRTRCYVSGIDHVTLRVLVLCIRNFYRYFSISTSRFINTHDCPHRFPFRRSPKYVHLFPHSLTCTPVVLRHYYMLTPSTQLPSASRLAPSALTDCATSPRPLLRDRSPHFLQLLLTSSTMVLHF